MHKSIPLEPEVRKQLRKQVGALPLYCLTLGLALLWARNLGFPKFGCYKLEIYWPKLGQGGREAFQGYISEGDTAAGLRFRCKSPLALKQSLVEDSQLLTTWGGRALKGDKMGVWEMGRQEWGQRFFFWHNSHVQSLVLHQVALTQESTTELLEMSCWWIILKPPLGSSLAINQGERWIKITVTCKITVTTVTRYSAF